MPLGKTVVEKREQKGMSQKKLAELTGLQQSRLCRIEKGYVDDPGVYALIRIAQALECSLGELLDMAACCQLQAA